jgi:hypothetical protein
MAKANIKRKNTIRQHKKARRSFRLGSMLPRVKVPRAISGNLKTVLDGSFLTRESFTKQAPFFFYVLALAFIYIAINFHSDKTLLSIERTKDEIKELRFEYITVSSELTQFTQASNVSKLLQDEGLKRPVTPPEKIILTVTEKQ